MANCANCGSTAFRNGVCLQCGEGPRIGPPANEVDAAYFAKRRAERTAEIRRVFEAQNADPDYICPKCSEEFDGWDCKCGYRLPEKRRKVVGRLLGPEEAKKVRKRLGLE